MIATNLLERTAAGELRLLATDIEALQRQLAVETDRANYGWRNVDILEKSRQEEVAKRDALQVEVAKLRYHLTELAKFADRAGMVLVTLEAEDTTEGEMLQEIIDGISKWAPAAILGQAAAPPPAPTPDISTPTRCVFYRDGMPD